MKTRPEIEVFDDPEYCSDSVSDPCPYLDHDGYSCDLYRDGNRDPVYLQVFYTKPFSKSIKCDRCKSDYAEAKTVTADVWLG